MKTRNLALAIVAAALLGETALAQTPAPQPLGFGNVVQTAPIAPFAIVGLIESFTLDPGMPGLNPPYTRGARMTVNGTPVVIPANTVIVMPAAQLTPYDIFMLAPGADGAHSGLALDDPPPFTPLASHEVSITGNLVNGQYIAGLVTISQETLNVHNGYITQIEYASGDICVGAKPVAAARPQGTGCTGGEARLRLNDPVGRYGMPQKGQDPRFVVDDQNPTVRAVTGYPMCVPRNNPGTADDPLCPRGNRPWGGGPNLPLTRFVMDTQDLAPVIPGAAPVIGSTLIPACPGCDPRQQVPFMVDDYITYNGTLAADAAGTFISAWQVVGQLGIYTRPCGVYGWSDDVPLKSATPCQHLRDEGYIVWEVGEVGTQGSLVDGVKIEGQDRIKVEGFTTDPSRQVEIYAITSNPGNVLAASGTPPAIPADPAITTSMNPADAHLRWIANIVPLRIPFGRYTMFVQRDIQRRLPTITTAGVIPIIDNHVGLQGQPGQVEYGAPRQLYTRISGSTSFLSGQQRPHNVKPVAANTPGLQGWPVPTPGFVGLGGVTATMANGLVPGQYLQPIPTYIFPESVQVGDPVIPNNFECLDFLVRGWTIASQTNPAGSVVVGQLSPWPGGLPSTVTSTDGAVPPKSIRCSSTIPLGADPIPRAVPRGGVPVPIFFGG